MVETHKKEKNTVITKINLTISNAEHIKQTLRTKKLYRHQQHLPKISQNLSGVRNKEANVRHKDNKTVNDSDSVMAGHSTQRTRQGPADRIIKRP